MSLQNINSYTYSPGFSQGDQYHNAVLCISGNVQSIYLDGILVGSTTTASNILSYYPTINQILLGCAGDKSNGFTGYLDDFRMYNYAFNPSQVSNLYSNRNIVAYYPFDSCFNNVANNIVTTGNNATLSYDATLVGNASISNSTYQIGTGSLNLTNTAGTSSSAYIKSSCGFAPNSDTGLSISLWFKTTGISGRKMRLFDLCPALGTQGIFVDISGTNEINTLSNSYTLPVIVVPVPSLPISSVYYKLIASSGTSLYNEISKSYDGTLMNGASISTSGLSLISSSNQYAVLPPFTNTGSQLSISIWYKQSTQTTGYPYLYSFVNGEGTYIGAYINANSTRLTCFLNSGHVQDLYTGSLNVWNHFVWVINGASWTVYINGVATTYTNANALSSTIMARRLNLGCNQNDTANCFNGYLKEFMVYNKLLTSTEVTNIYTTNYNFIPANPYSTDFTTGTPNSIANGTIFDGWTANSVANTAIYSSSTFYGSSFMDATQSASASGRSILFQLQRGTGPLGISRSIYLYANYTYTLTFYIGTRTGTYYNSNNYFRGTVTNSTSNSTPNPIFNITGMISTETLKTYTFTVPTSSDYTFAFISGSAVSITDSAYILRNVNILG